MGESTDDVALVLWQTIRHVRDWLGASANERRKLFPTPLRPSSEERRKVAARLAPELDQAWETFDRMLRLPTTATPIEVGVACRQVAEWASGQSYGETAVQYVEAAATADLDSAQAAIAAGRVCRDVGEFTRAELWFKRGIGLARTHDEGVEYIRGHLGYGLLLMHTGRHAKARMLFNTAASRAMKHGFEWLAAEAQHDLFRFTTIHGDYPAAEEHAKLALQWYPKSNERVPYLAADVAFYPYFPEEGQARGSHSRSFTICPCAGRTRPIDVF